MWDKKVAARIVYWGVGIFVIAFLLLSYLAGSNDYISDIFAFKIFLILAGCMALITVQYLIVTDKKERKEIIVGLALATAFFIIRRWLR